MSVLVLLIPVTLCLGLTALLAFLWNLRSGQYEDLSGAAERVLLDKDDVPAHAPAGRREPKRDLAENEPEEPKWSQT